MCEAFVLHRKRFAFNVNGGDVLIWIQLHSLGECVYVCMRVCVCVYVCMRVCVCVCVCVEREREREREGE